MGWGIEKEECTMYQFLRTKENAAVMAKPLVCPHCCCTPQTLIQACRHKCLYGSAHRHHTVLTGRRQANSSVQRSHKINMSIAVTVSPHNNRALSPVPIEKHEAAFS